MPALVAFNRRWQVGSDDMVFIFGGGLIARLLWLGVLCAIFGMYHSDIKLCHASHTLHAFFIGVIVMTVIVILNEIAIIWVSMKGTIMNTRPRRRIPMLLYLQLVLYVPEICLSILGIYWAFYNSKGCELGLTIPLQITVVLQWCILLSVFIVVLVFFDPLGSSHVTGDHHDNQIMHKSTKLWERRCWFLCCCFAGKDQEYVNAISEIAEMFSSELHGVDAVPSDVAVGLILLQQQQEEEEITRLEQCQAKIEGAPVDLSDPRQKALIDNAAHFMKYSLGSYGWPMYVFMHPCCGVFHFCGKIRCCAGCVASDRTNVIQDNCCMCNTAALHLQSDLPEENLIYSSYHNKLYEIPFYVALDDERKAVVISIRGTLSMRDTLTDLTGHCERIDIEGLEDGMAHKGMFLSAQFIKNQLIDKKILQEAFSEAQQRGGNYRLVVVGHSLGAGTASVLSVLLKPLHPDLQCFAYSNPSVLNASATAHVQDYIMSVIVGNDVVPRMSVKNMNTLKQDLETVIINCNLPKYRVLMTGCWRALCFFLGKKNTYNGKTNQSVVDNLSRDAATLRPVLTEPLLGEHQPLTSTDGNACSSYVIEEAGAQDNRNKQKSSRNGCQLVQLYPAGRILQINENSKNRPLPGPQYELLWTNKEIYHRVLIHHRMFKDHFPDVVMKALKNIAENI